MLPPLRPSNVRPATQHRQGVPVATGKRDTAEAKVPSVRPARIGIKACAIKLRGGLTVLDRAKS